MACDRKCRDVLSDAIEQFLSGSIDSWAFDDMISGLKSSDVMCIELRRQLWLFHDDTRRYFNRGRDSLPPAAAQILRRWTRLLHSRSTGRT